MARTKLEIESSSLDELSDRLNANAVAADKVASSALNATNVLANGSAKAAGAVNGTTASIQNQAKEILRNGDAVGAMSKAAFAEAKARRDAYIEQERASGRLTDSQAEIAKQLATIIALFGTLEKVASRVDTIKLPVNTDELSGITQAFIELSDAEKDTFAQLVDLGDKYQVLQKEGDRITELVDKLKESRAATKDNTDEAKRYDEALSGATDKQAAIATAIEATHDAAAKLAATLKQLSVDTPVSAGLPSVPGAPVADGNIAPPPDTGSSEADVNKVGEAALTAAANMVDFGQKGAKAASDIRDGLSSVTDGQDLVRDSLAALLNKYAGLPEVNKMLDDIEQANKDSFNTEEERVLSVEEVTAAQKKGMEAAAASSKAAAMFATVESQAAKQREAELQRAAFLESQRKGYIEDTIGEINRLSEAQKKAKTDEDLASINKQLAEARTSLQELQKVGLPDFSGAQGGAKSLRARVLEARTEVTRLIEESGKITPEVLQAAEAAAHLNSEVKKTDALIAAVNPQERFTSIAKLGASAAGGFSAAKGAMALLGLETGKTEDVTQKLVAVIAIADGLNAFSGITEALTNVKALISVVTVAKKKDTVATVASTVATAASTTATTASAGATGVLTGAVKTLTTAMAANPVLLAATVLIGIASALVILGDNAEDSADKANLVVASMQKIADLNEKSAGRQKQREELQDELDLLTKGSTEEAQRNKIRLNAESERRAITTAINDQLLTEATLRERIGKLSGTDNKDELAALSEYQQALEASVEKQKELRAGLSASTMQQTIDTVKFDIKAAEERTKREEEEAKKRQAAAKEAAAYMRSLQEQIARDAASLRERAGDSQFSESSAKLEASASLAAHNGQLEEETKFREQLIELTRTKQQEEIDLMERDMKRKVAMVRLNQQIGQEAIQGLSESMLNARLDQLVANENIGLKEESLTQLGVIRANIDAEAQRKVTAVIVAETDKRMKARDDEGKNQLESLSLREQYAQALVDASSGEESELLDILKQNGIDGVESVRSVEEAKLQIVLDAAQKRLAILQESGTLEDAIQAERLKKVIDDTQKQIAATPPFTLDIGKLLGITDDAVASLKPLVENALSSIAGYVKDSLFKDKIAAIDEYLKRIDDSIAATQRSIDIEVQARAAGDTSNVEGEQAKLAALQKLRDDAQQQQEKIAQKQRIADAGAIVSGTVLTVVNVLKDSALKGGILGIALAAAVIPGIFALISAAKGKAQSVGQGFYKGTPFVDHEGRHVPGIDTVPAMLTRGERVHTVEENKRNYDLYEALRTRDKDGLVRSMVDTAEREGVTLDDILREFGHTEPLMLPDRPDHLPAELNTSRFKLEGLRSRDSTRDAMSMYLRDIARDSAELVAMEKERTDTHFLADGTEIRIDSSGNRTTIRRT